MKKDVPSTFLIFCISCSVLICTHFVFEMFYEEGTDPYFINILSGSFSARPEHILNTYGFHFITSYFYSFLYEWMPEIPWYDIAIIFLLALSITFYIQLAIQILSRIPAKLIGTTSLLFFLLLYFLFFENLVLIQVTRVVFLLAISSALLLLSDDKQISRRKKILLNGCIFIALLSRIEPAMLAWALLIPFAVFSEGIRKNNILKTIKSWWIFGSLSIIVSVGVNIPFDEADANYKKFRPYQFTLWDFDQPGIKLRLQNKSDSLIYLAAKKSFLTDSKHINSEFFKKAGINPLDKSPEYFLNYLRDFDSRFDEMKKNLYKSWRAYPFLSTSAILIYLSILIWIFINERNKFLRFALFLICFLLLILFLTAFMKMEDRVFGPLVQVHLFLCFYFFTREKTIPPNQAKMIFAMLIFSTGLQIKQYSSHTLGKIDSRKVASSYINLMKEDIPKRYPNKVIWTNLYVMDHLFIPLFHSHQLPKTVIWASLDNAILFYYPSWIQKTKSLTKADDFAGIIQSILNQPEENLFLSTQDRMEMIQEYCENVSGICFSFYEKPSHFNQKFKDLYPTYQTPYKIGVYELKNE